MKVSVDMLWTSAVFVQPGSGPRRRVRGSGDGRAEPGTAQRQAGRPGGGQAGGDEVRNFSHPTDACRSVGAERNRGSLLRSSSSHPLCPCGRRRHCSRGVPLVSGTSATRCASTRIVQPSLRIGASRWIIRGLPDSRSGCVSRDVAEKIAAGDCARWFSLGSCRGPHGGLFPMICMVGKPCPDRRSRRLFAQRGVVGADRRRSPDAGQAAFAGVRGAC